MDSRDFIGPGFVIDEPGINSPVRVAISDAYYGLFITDTLHLAVTAGGGPTWRRATCPTRMVAT